MMDLKTSFREKTKYGFVHVNMKIAQCLNIAFGKDKNDIPCTIDLLKEERGFIVKLKN